MDALKKAEETKRQAETGAFAHAGGDSSTAVGRRAGGAHMPSQPESLPALPSRLELLDDQFTPPRAAAAAKPSPDRAAAAAAQEKDRQAAAQVFAAKTGSSDKSFQLVLGLSTAAAVLVIAGYFWWQLQPRSSLTAVAPVTHSSTPNLLGDTASAPASMKTVSSSNGPAAMPAPASKVAEAPPVLPPVEMAPDPEQPALARERPARVAVAEKGKLSDEAPALATLTEDSAIQITRSRLRVDPSVANGYRHFQSGDLAAAQQEYERALRSDPRNTDALNGLAAISLRRNRHAEAAEYYQRTLQADPLDATAQAALINLRGSRDPRRTESRLRTLLAGQPDAHAAQFALGNLYAAQGQWREAQEAYFQAYSAVPDDPDYQFNLAVSLDQLHQPKPALQYYQSALTAAAARPAAFDKAQAAARVRELQP